MVKSKYSAKPDVTDRMVDNAVVWIEQSLVEYIPAMVAYPAFSARLLHEAMGSPKRSPAIRQENVVRSMDFLAGAPLMDTPAMMADPEFVRQLLDYVFDGTPAVQMPSNAVTDSGRVGQGSLT